MLVCLSVGVCSFLYTCKSVSACGRLCMSVCVCLYVRLYA